MRRQDFLNTIAAFWARVDKSGDCWLWTGELNNQGYGRFEFWHDNGRQRTFAHRLSLCMTGVALADDDVVLHSCDTPACVNPAHLTVGTQRDNIRDAQAKGRTDVSGLVAGYPHRCKTCGVDFIGAPNRRYCEAHTPPRVLANRARRQRRGVA